MGSLDRRPTTYPFGFCRQQDRQHTGPLGWQRPDPPRSYPSSLPCLLCKHARPSNPFILWFAVLMFSTISGSLLLARSKPRYHNSAGFWYSRVRERWKPLFRITLRQPETVECVMAALRLDRLRPLVWIPCAWRAAFRWSKRARRCGWVWRCRHPSRRPGSAAHRPSMHGRS
jgi:hypothetical protein